LTEEEQAALRHDLDWFGELALAPAGGSDPAARARVLAPARRVALTLTALLSLGMLASLVGGGLLLLAVVLLRHGKLGGGLEPSQGGSAVGAIYAETFALYFLLYMALALAARWLSAWVGGSLWLQGAAILLSLVALGWPVLRGVSWQQVRRDVGLGTGRGVLREAAAGVLGYLAALPFVGVALLVVMVLLSVQKRLGLEGGPSHPAVEEALHGGPRVWWELLVLGCLVAPLVEETMFRGFLYRHLRETSRGWGAARSVVFSALASGFLFAVIHPQGWLGVPVLMTLGAAFAVLREWRGSFVPNLCAHALNNGMALVALLLIAG
jgi:membrane protease YdiL (CAAX protease family)